MKKIIVDPDPRLRKVCAEVTTINKKVTKLAAEMLSIVTTMRNNPDKYPGKPLGLAAPQVGEMIQLFVIDTPSYSLTMLNPRIIKTAGSCRVLENCLSLPGRKFLVKRPKLVKVRGLDLNGNVRSVRLHDQLAQVLIHEVEHLRGIMLDNVMFQEVFPLESIPK